MIGVPDDPAPKPDWVAGLLTAFQERSFQEHPRADATPGEGLRQRKKRQMRQLISDTATAIFLERGFDEVRVSDVAAACGVSEKTVYNYFPTKESLLLDREEAMVADIRRALGPGAPVGSPIEAAIAVIIEQVRGLYDDWAVEHQRALDLTVVSRFSDLIERTPSLRAAHLDMMDRLVRVAAEAMAARAGVNPEDPEPQIAANAIVGLWRLQFQAMTKHSDGQHTPAEVRDAVIGEVRRAARLIDTGLWSFGLAVQGSNGREQLKAAAGAANEARQQVVLALKQARDAWRQVVADAQLREDSRERPKRGRRKGG
jgi:AcrR family transcriptional regulator